MSLFSGDMILYKRILNIPLENARLINTFRKMARYKIYVQSCSFSICQWQTYLERNHSGYCIVFPVIEDTMKCAGK